MWKKVKQAATNCLEFLTKCGRLSSSIEDDLADILENLVEDADDVPGEKSILINNSYNAG